MIKNEMEIQKQMQVSNMNRREEDKMTSKAEFLNVGMEWV